MGDTEKDANGIGLQRVKVYRLNEAGNWDDKGTGQVTVEYLEVRRCIPELRRTASLHGKCRGLCASKQAGLWLKKGPALSQYCMYAGIADTWSGGDCGGGSVKDTAHTQDLARQQLSAVWRCDPRLSKQHTADRQPFPQTQTDCTPESSLTMHAMCAEDTIITWTDSDIGVDVALSFQEVGGCTSVW